MERRDALRLLGSAALLPVMPSELLAILSGARAEVGTAPTPRTLNPHQYQAVTRIAEIILPDTNTPGATAARVNDFIDLILTEWYNDEERARFLSGLVDADARSRTQFAKAFVDLSASQQEEIVRALDEDMVREIGNSRASALDFSYNFFHSFKRLTLTGYYTSEIGAKDELHFKIITGHYNGCVAATSQQDK